MAKVAKKTCQMSKEKAYLAFDCKYVSWSHRRTGRHFTGGAEKICPENNNLPGK